MAYITVAAKWVGIVDRLVMNASPDIAAFENALPKNAEVRKAIKGLLKQRWWGYCLEQASMGNHYMQLRSPLSDYIVGCLNEFTLVNHNAYYVKDSYNNVQFYIESTLTSLDLGLLSLTQVLKETKDKLRAEAQAQASATIMALQASVEAMHASIEKQAKASGDIAGLREQLKAKFAEKTDSGTQTSDDYDAQLQVLRDEITAKNTEIKRLKQAHTAALMAKDTAFTTLQESKSALRGQQKKTKEELDKAQQDNNRALKIIADLEAQLAKQAGLNKKRASANNYMPAQNGNANLNSNDDDNLAHDKQPDALEQAQQDLKAALETHQHYIAASQAQLQAREQQITALASRVQSISNENTAYKTQLAARALETERHLSRIEQLEKMLAEKVSHGISTTTSASSATSAPMRTYPVNSNSVDLLANLAAVGLCKTDSEKILDDLRNNWSKNSHAWHTGKLKPKTARAKLNTRCSELVEKFELSTQSSGDLCKLGQAIFNGADVRYNNVKNAKDELAKAAQIFGKYLQEHAETISTKTTPAVQKKA